MSRRRRRMAPLTVATLSLAAILLGGCGGGGAPSGAPEGRPAANPSSSPVQTIASRLRIPWGIAFLPDGTALVTERGPAWREVNSPPVRPRILSVSPAGQVTDVLRLDGVSARGEGGLLGIAVSPNYASDHWVYIYYTTPEDRPRRPIPPRPGPAAAADPDGDPLRPDPQRRAARVRPRDRILRLSL